MKPISSAIVVDVDIRGGLPTLRHTNLTVSELLATIEDDYSISAIAEERNIELALIEKALRELAEYFSRSFVEESYRPLN